MLPSPPIPSHTLPSLPLPTLPYPRIHPLHCSPSPTLPHPLRFPSYHTLAFPTLCSTLLPSHPSPLFPPSHPVPCSTLPYLNLSSPTKPYPLPYHIPWSRPRDRSLIPSPPLGYLTFPYSTFHATTLPTPPPPPTLPFPLTYFPPIPSHSIISAQLSYPNTLPYPPLSPPLPYHTLPSPPIYPALPKGSGKVRGARMYRGWNGLVQNVFWRTEMTLSLKGPADV